MLRPLFLVSVLFWQSQGFSHHELVNIQLDLYEKTARRAMVETQRAQPNFLLLQQDTDGLIRNGLPIIQAYGVAVPGCKAQLDRIVSLLPELRLWPAEKIEAVIEKGQGLPRGRNCYDARDIIAHPAIAASLLRNMGRLTDTLRAKLYHQFDEALEHVQKIRLVLKSSH